MNEQFTPGEYTVTNVDGLIIRKSMSTTVPTNRYGKYSNGENFKVYQVYPEKGGILWGRVSSSTEEGSALYCGLRVNNHPLVKFEKPFDQEQLPTTSLLNWANGIDAWARVQGYKGPKPE